jgi:hypothetical protein
LNADVQFIRYNQRDALHIGSVAALRHLSRVILLRQKALHSVGR